MNTTRLPDPIERGESRAESFAAERIRGDQFKCPGCDEWCDLNCALSMSPDPYSPPICSTCAGWGPA